MVEEIHVMVSRESAILAVGTAGKRSPFWMAGVAGVICVVIGGLVSLYLALQTVPAPQSMTVLAKWPPRDAKVLPVQIRQTLPSLWQEALALPTYTSVYLGLADEEGVPRAFAIVPRWQVKRLPSAFTVETSGLWARVSESPLTSAAEERIGYFYSRTHRLSVRMDPASTSTAMFAWKEGAWVGTDALKVKTGLRPVKAHVSVVYGADQSEGLAFLESLSGLPFRPADLWQPPMVVSVHEGVSGKPAFQFAYEDPIAVERQLAMRASLGLGERTLVEMPDGTWMAEWRNASGTVDGLATSTRATFGERSIQFPAVAMGEEWSEVEAACPKFQPTARYDAPAVSRIFSHILGGVDKSWPALQVGSRDGFSAFCFEP